MTGWTTFMRFSVEIAPESSRGCASLTSVQRKQLTKSPRLTSPLTSVTCVAAYRGQENRCQGSKRLSRAFTCDRQRSRIRELAHAGIADCYAILPFYDQGTPIQFYHKAKAAADTGTEWAVALPRGARRAGTHSARCSTMGLGRCAARVEGFVASHSRRAARRPISVYAYYLSTVGRVNDAVEEKLHGALEWDPVSLPSQRQIGRHVLFARHYRPGHRATASRPSI